MTDLTGRRVLVPGGTGAVGEGVVRAYLAAGADVVVPTRTRNGRTSSARLLGDAATDRLHLVVHDYTTFDRRRAAGRDQMELRLGGIDDVVAPIGGWWAGKHLWEITEADWQGAFVESGHHPHGGRCAPCCPRLEAAGAYAVVVGASASFPVPGSGLVSMEQAAVLMMQRSWRPRPASGPGCSRLVLGPVASRVRRRRAGLGQRRPDRRRRGRAVGRPGQASREVDLHRQRRRAGRARRAPRVTSVAECREVWSAIVQPTPKDPLMPDRPRLVLFGQESDADTVSVADVLRRETVGGVLMLAAAAAALVWANVAPATYAAVLHVRLGPLDLEHWAADGLLAIFFFLAGLELKRELTVGTLAEPARALVPVVAAVCGMAVPAAVCLAVNLATRWPAERVGGPDGDRHRLRARDPGRRRAGPARRLRAFLLTLAIVDDLGSILVIATVFTERVAFGWLAGAAVVGALVVAAAAPAGARLVPLRPPRPAVLVVRPRERGARDDRRGGAGPAHARFGDGSERPANAWEHRWRPVSAGVAVPLFALFAAGVS